MVIDEYLDYLGLFNLPNVAESLWGFLFCKDYPERTEKLLYEYVTEFGEA